MGQWNTLHLFNESILQKDIIPQLQNNLTYIEDKFSSINLELYFTNPDHDNKSRIKEIQKISRSISSDFRESNLLPTNRLSKEFQEIYYSHQFEEFRILLFIIFFSECAQLFPCFKLGRALLHHNLISDNKLLQEILLSLLYPKESRSIFPSEDGIRNWITYSDVKTLYENYSQIHPNILQNAPIHNKNARIYHTEFKEFLSVAYTNHLGLVSCVDMPDEIINSPCELIPRNLWKSFNLEKNLILND